MGWEGHELIERHDGIELAGRGHPGRRPQSAVGLQSLAVGSAILEGVTKTAERN